ncbi:MAG: hypothetical protein FE78DRAFT_468480 [Acidomyces sp. 'richmondensis']|nr:MAG: hypothetical protein FE78DRAFT_468480 [Acidomyces sp. 'richmondensis']
MVCRMTELVSCRISTRFAPRSDLNSSTPVYHVTRRTLHHCQGFSSKWTIHRSHLISRIRCQNLLHAYCHSQSENELRFAIGAYITHHITPMHLSLPYANTHHHHPPPPSSSSSSSSPPLPTQNTIARTPQTPSPCPPRHPQEPRTLARPRSPPARHTAAQAPSRSGVGAEPAR